MKSSLKKLADHARRSGGLWLVIAVLMLAVIGLNLYVWLRYCGQADELKYFETHSFDALLAALLIPLLLSTIADAFKINEKMEAERDLVAQEKRKQQIEAIEKTNAMWSELYRLSTEVAYFKAGKGRVPIREIRKKLECFTNSAEEVVNRWHLNFPGVALEMETLSLSGLNLLLLSALTVADVVEDEPEDQAKQMQNCLLVIQDGVRSGLHYSLMQVFNFAMEANQPKLENEIARLRVWSGIFGSLMNKHRPNLPPAADTDAATKTATDAAMKKRDAYLADYKKKFAAKAALRQLEKPAGGATDPIPKGQFLDSAEFKNASEALKRAEQAAENANNEYYQAVIDCPPKILGLSRKRILSDDQIWLFARELFFYNDQINMNNIVETESTPT